MKIYFHFTLTERLKKDREIYVKFTKKKIIRELSVKFDMFSESPRDISRFSP